MKYFLVAIAIALPMTCLAKSDRDLSIQINNMRSSSNLNLTTVIPSSTDSQCSGYSLVGADKDFKIVPATLPADGKIYTIKITAQDSVKAKSCTYLKVKDGSDKLVMRCRIIYNNDHHLKIDNCVDAQAINFPKTNGTYLIKNFLT